LLNVDACICNIVCEGPVEWTTPHHQNVALCVMSIVSHATLIPYYHASMLTLQNSIISRALRLPHVWYYGVSSVHDALFPKKEVDLKTMITYNCLLKSSTFHNTNAPH
jgi:hypothetical protein